MCLAFEKQGCHVYASARRLSALEYLPATVSRVQLDVGDKAACQATVDLIIKESGRIDILVNNAGAGASGPLLDFDVDAAEACFAVNLFSPMRSVFDPSVCTS